jgi:hypothetical protein
MKGRATANGSDSFRIVLVLQENEKSRGLRNASASRVTGLRCTGPPTYHEVLVPCLPLCWLTGILVAENLFAEDMFVEDLVSGSAAVVSLGHVLAKRRPSSF